MKNDAHLYKISDIVRACGVSRSTVLRLEEKGILTPCYISPESGHRYYDNFDVVKISHVKHFKEMGLTSNEILNYFSSKEGALEVLHCLEERLYHFQRNVEELRLYLNHSDEVSVQIMEMPAEHYLIKRGVGLASEEFRAVMESAYVDCLEKGISIKSRPVCVELECEDYLQGIITEHPYPFSVCMPVEEASAPPEAVYYPACKVLSVVLYGDYRRSSEVWLRLGEEIRARDLRPIGWPRAIPMAAEYGARGVKTDEWCIRLMVPIE